MNGSTLGSVWVAQIGFGRLFKNEKEDMKLGGMDLRRMNMIKIYHISKTYYIKFSRK